LVGKGQTIAEPLDRVMDLSCVPQLSLPVPAVADLSVKGSINYFFAVPLHNHLNPRQKKHIK
jgi:hypothetical protein